MQKASFFPYLAYTLADRNRDKWKIRSERLRNLARPKPLEIYPRRKFRFPDRRERIREKEEASCSKEGGFTFMEMPGPACKYLATTVRTPINFQPVFNFAKTEHRPRIAPSRTTLPFQPVQTLSTREHPRARSWLFQPRRRNTVSCVICIRFERSPLDVSLPITVIFIPQIGVENSGWSLNFEFESLDLWKFRP